MNAPPAALSVLGLSFRYNGREVLSNIGFTVERGNYVGLVGPNGSGKSTLVKNVLGILSPSAGEVSIFGLSPRAAAAQGKVGYLPQKIAHFNPYFPASVTEVVSMGLSPLRMPKDAEAAAAETALRAMDIWDIRDKRVGDLSGGQLQRVLLARALASGPELLLLDEPTTALDPETRGRFYDTIHTLNRERGITVVLVTHDVGTIGKYASRLLYVDRRLIFFGGFNEFCESGDMKKYFGEFSQHVICHRHDGDAG